MNVYSDLSLGQHFFINLQLARDLIDSSTITKNDTVIDIGAGYGTLSKALATKARHVKAIEIDSRLEPHFERFIRSQGNIEFINQDILQYKLPAEYKIFANIPFYISAEILKKTLLAKQKPQEAYFFLERKVLEKYTGQLTNTYSEITAKIFNLYETNVLYKFSRNDFKPRPNVEIYLARFTLRKEPISSEEKYFFFLENSYRYAKKTVLKSLKKKYGYNKTKFALKKAGISQQASASQVSPEQWNLLYNELTY